MPLRHRTLPPACSPPQKRHRRIASVTAEPQRAPERGPLPAWSLPASEAARIRIEMQWPEEVTREWAWEGATGAGVRVCILDSGVEPSHPLVGSLTGAWVV